MAFDLAAVDQWSPDELAGVNAVVAAVRARQRLRTAEDRVLARIASAPLRAFSNKELGDAQALQRLKYRKLVQRVGWSVWRLNAPDDVIRRLLAP